MLSLLSLGCSDSRDASRATPSPTAADPSPRTTPDPRAPEDSAEQLSQPGVAWLLRETSTGRILAQHQPAHLETRILPGSVAKVVTALAALDQGHADLRVTCSRRLVVHGRSLDCVHPARAEPLTLVEALAHSCNTYFTRLASRLDLAAWQRIASRLGVPAQPLPAPAELLAIGLEGPRAPSTTWQRIIVRAVEDESIPITHRQVVRDGLRLAVREGTAGALVNVATDTLAKTGTIVDAGESAGLAVVVRPEDDLDLVVRVRGAAGRDAASLAAAVLARRAPDARVLRVGRSKSGRQATTSGASDVSDAPEIDVTPLEAYVARVVAAEATAGMPEAVLDTIAIAARTYATAQHKRHDDEGFDVCDSTHCQAASRTVWPGAVQAAARTHGVVLADEGRVVPVYYSAACAGRLRAARSIWGGDAASSGEYVGVEPHAHAVPAWQSDVSERDLRQTLRGAGLRGELLRDLRVDVDSADAAPQTVELVGFAPQRITADTFRTIVGRALGWDVLKSYTWTPRRTAAGFRFEGRGKGHGVGICVAGATAYATRLGPSARAEDVLRAYYPRLRTRSLADTVRLRVTHASQSQAPALLRDVQMALAELRRHLNLAATRTVEIVEHPTIEAYQRATGRAWWTGGSTRLTTPTAARIDLPPLATLEQTGRLQSILRHELVHVLTATSLRDAPLWAREGLAVLLSSQPNADGPSAVPDDVETCPTDAEIAFPGGDDAMRAVYARASACVARALAAGTSWRALGQ